jgi:hypothetical protein
MKLNERKKTIELIRDKNDKDRYFSDYERLKNDLSQVMKEHDLTAKFYHLARHVKKGGGKWYLQHDAKFDGDLDRYMRVFFLDRDSNARVYINNIGKQEV